jgi:ABC-type antimicrobial peptide transport system permease subunit
LLFGLLSLVLASTGLYGVTAYNAGRRVTEIGVRMALGAKRRSVVALIWRGVLALVACGLTLGVALVLASARVLKGQLYGFNPYDPMVIAIAVLVLALSALMATLIPTFRAAATSPAEALRSE